LYGCLLSGDAAFCVHVLADVEGVAELVRDEFAVDAEAVERARAGAA